MWSPCVTRVTTLPDGAVGSCAPASPLAVLPARVGCRPCAAGSLRMPRVLLLLTFIRVGEKGRCESPCPSRGSTCDGCQPCCGVGMGGTWHAGGLGAAGEQRGCPEGFASFWLVGRTGDLCAGTGETPLAGLGFVTSFHPSRFCCFLEHRGGLVVSAGVSAL